MKTECTQETFDFYPLIKREVVAKFDGGTITSDAGGKPLAGKSTLNRLELTLPDADRESRYKKIVINEDAVDRFFIDTFLQAHPEPPGAHRH